MNWRRISENWQAFIKDNGMTHQSENKNYFYGTLEVYKAKEEYKGFKVLYENRLNKPATATAFGNKANSFEISTQVHPESEAHFIIETNSFLTRIFKGNDKIKTESNIEGIDKIIPTDKIETVVNELSDLKISLSQPDKDKFLKFSSGIQPERLSTLEESRNIFIELIENLHDKNIVEPAHNTGYTK